MKKLLIVAVILFTCAAVLDGCTQRIGDFTIISTKNVDIGGKYKLIGKGEGSDKKIMILGIPIGIPNLKTAVDECIGSQAGGDLLTNAVLTGGGWSIILVGQSGYTVTGDVYGKAGMSDLMSPSKDLFSLEAFDGGYQLVCTADPTKTIKVDYLLAAR